MSDDLCSYMMEKVKSDNVYDQYVALLFALQIPSICGRLDIPKTDENTGVSNQDPKILYKPDGTPHDKNLYVAWLRQHPSIYRHLSSRETPFSVLPEKIYELRNRVFHEGAVFDSTATIVLVAPGCNGMLTSFGDYISVDSFCKHMFDAVGASTSQSLFNLDGARWWQLSSRIRTMSRNEFSDLDKLTEERYDAFWSARPSEDLELWQRFYRSDVPDIECVREKLVDDDLDNIFGLSRDDAQRLVTIADELCLIDSALREDVVKFIDECR